MPRLAQETKHNRCQIIFGNMIMNCNNSTRDRLQLFHHGQRRAAVAFIVFSQPVKGGIPVAHFEPGQKCLRSDPVPATRQNDQPAAVTHKSGCMVNGLMALDKIDIL